MTMTPVERRSANYVNRYRDQQALLDRAQRILDLEQEVQRLKRALRACHKALENGRPALLTGDTKRSWDQALAAAERILKPQPKRKP